MTPVGDAPLPITAAGERDDNAPDQLDAASTREADTATPFPAPAATSALNTFLAEAARRRSASAHNVAAIRASDDDWVETDPRRITDLMSRNNPVDRALKRYKEGHTRSNFRLVLRAACAHLQDVDRATVSHSDVRAYPWFQLTVEEAAAFHRRIYRVYDKQATRNSYVNAVRAVVKQCFRAELIGAARRDELLEELYTLAPGTSDRGRRLTLGEITALMHACETNGPLPARARDTAIVALFRTSGMRLGELIGLRLGDWDRGDNSMRLRHTKNGRSHRVFLHPDVIPYLERWLGVRGDVEGPLFTPVIGRGRNRHLSPNTVLQMLRLKADKAGIEPFGSHDFRRTFATELLRTHDVALVGKLLNHSKLSTTLIYDLSGPQEQRAAVAHLDLPSINGAQSASTADSTPASQVTAQAEPLTPEVPGKTQGAS